MLELWAFLLFVHFTDGNWGVYEIRHRTYTSQTVCNQDASDVVGREQEKENVLSVSRSICYPYHLKDEE